ncbi:hypothetical protein [Sphingomonas sp. CFBP 13720]|uniref:hypothetical protein n=1 Tax=Sphingomonas sp. CFBP 13720 TaxID=2775302 RepID=UPI00177F53D4|nr:hypothetical protein [Sphingomonas sp. CFBP 13720]MBD8677514.1 hypothetical protein [Sphingomonas sp. CFBP 13720]
MFLAVLLLQAAAPPPRSFPAPGDDAGCDRNAIRYTDEREWDGVWINDFEGSEFIEGATSLAGLRRNVARAWFDDRDRAAFDGTEFVPGPFGKAYRIRFIGRRSIDAPPGSRCGFGHMGMSTATIVATRITAMEPLGDIR